jgi:hypothetical protein
MSNTSHRENKCPKSGREYGAHDILLCNFYIYIVAFCCVQMVRGWKHTCSNVHCIVILLLLVIEVFICLICK